MASPARAAARSTRTTCWSRPGWVDIHTHYDGQATWDPYLTPSSWHGVTTVVMGNCGVGFAPVRPDSHAWLIGLMEGVEDIPGTALAEGIRWSWERFPEYLDALEAMPRAIDVGAQVPHGAVRAYVMGERGAKNAARPRRTTSPSMATIVREGIAAGALGFTTSRTLLHRAIDGEPVPGTFAAADELLGIGRVLGELGRGVLELASDLMPEEPELAWMEQVSAATGRPVTFALPAERRRSRRSGAGCSTRPTTRPRAARTSCRRWRHGRPACCSACRARCIRSSRTRRTGRIADLPLAERVRAAARPGDAAPHAGGAGRVQRTRSLAYLATAFHKIFPLGDPPDYEPPAEASIAAIARRRGVTAEDVAYDRCSSATATQMLYLPFLNYSGFDFEAIREMLLHPRTRSSGSPTAALTAASSATPARRPSCSRTGAAIASRASASGSSSWCAARRATRRRSTACTIGACSRPA